MSSNGSVTSLLPEWSECEFESCDWAQLWSNCVVELNGENFGMFLLELLLNGALFLCEKLIISGATDDEKPFEVDGIP